MLASFGGAVLGVGLLATGRGTMQAALPFGTFLAVGAAIAAVVGDRSSPGICVLSMNRKARAARRSRPSSRRSSPC